MAFWKPDVSDPSRIVRTARTPDDPAGISEFPHLIVNQAGVLDYFAEFMANAPTRMTPDYGYEFQRLEVAGEGEYPVTVTLLHTSGPNEGQEKIVRAKYVVGADGGRSKGTPGNRLHPRRRRRQPRLGRHGRTRCHPLPGHPHQVRHANEILHPYTLAVRNVAWHSVYEVGHKLTDRFDDVLPHERGTRTPRVFITGDACHTHSAKANC